MARCPKCHRHFRLEDKAGMHACPHCGGYGSWSRAPAHLPPMARDDDDDDDDGEMTRRLVAELDRCRQERDEARLYWQAASVFVSDVSEALGLPPVQDDVSVDLAAIARQVVGQLEELKETCRGPGSGMRGAQERARRAGDGAPCSKPGAKKRPHDPPVRMIHGACHAFIAPRSPPPPARASHSPPTAPPHSPRPGPPPTPARRPRVLKVRAPVFRH
jgi:hypothetical protein